MVVESNPLVPTDVQAQLRSAVHESLALPSSCVPGGAVLVSMVDAAQAPLRRLQFSRIRELKCLVDRVTSLCWNHSDSFGHAPCVQAPATAFDRADPEVLYHLKCWAKWTLLSTALDVARLAFYVDADVLLLRNPFAAPAVAHFADAACRGVQLLYQWEGPGSNPLNSGQMLACSAAAVRHALSAMPRELSEFALPAGGAKLDQEYAHAALERSQFGIRRLPGPNFAGNCWFGPPNDPPWCDIFLFHAHCTGKKLAAKRGHRGGALEPRGLDRARGVHGRAWPAGRREQLQERGAPHQDGRVN